MSKIITWSIINNEKSFIKDLIEYHLQWVDGMYFLDNGSNDGTLEIIKDYASQDSRIFLEEYPIKYTTQYELSWHEMSDPFPEVDVRNYALQAVEKLSFDWLIQLDGDEIFTPETRDIIYNNSMATCIGHSTINPVCKLQEHPTEMRGGYNLYDPHVRIWRANQGLGYIANPNFSGKQYHCIPVNFKNKIHLFHHPMVKFTDAPIHFHLHWMYGNKLDNFYNKKGITDRREILKDQSLHEYSVHLPTIFWQRRNEWLMEKK